MAEDKTNIETLQSELGDPPAPNWGRPPTVLQILPALVTGGVERGTVDVARAVVVGGGRSLVVSAGGPMEHELTRHGGEHFTLPVDSKNPLVMRTNIERLADLIKRESVDLVHARSRAPAWSAWYAARRAGAHFVTTFHGTYSHGNAFKRHYNGVMTKGERVIAISDFIAGHIRKVYGVPTSRIRVIPRGVDISRFDPTRMTPERVVGQAVKWRLPDGMPVVMLPGRLTRWKGQTVFIEAIELLARDDIQCLIVGDDQGRFEYRRELESEIARRGLSHVLHVIEHCDDMPAAYMLTDVVVSASTEPEAFGRVVAEAQALGRPVVATDHGGARESVVDGETGWLTPPNDPQTLADSINTVLNQTTQQREQLAARSIAHIRKNFSKDVMCRKTLDVYGEVLNREMLAA